MALGEFALHQAVLRQAQTLETINVLCDRTHEEAVLALLQATPRELACHYAYALGSIRMIALHELAELQRIGVRRDVDAASIEAANARALAQLQAFMRQVRALELPTK